MDNERPQSAQLAQRCRKGSSLRIEIDIYRNEDGTFGYDLMTDCPIDNFAETLLSFKAAIKCLVEQIAKRRECPFHPTNNPRDVNHAKLSSSQTSR